MRDAISVFRRFATILRGPEALARSRRGAIAVEVALIAPILATIAFFSYDLAAITKSRDRAQFTFYSISDTITSRTDNVTCDYLDLIADLAYEAFTTGNYASTDGKKTELPIRGASDFRFQLRGLLVQDPATDPAADPSNLQANVMWAFHRTYNSIDDEGARSPGNLISIPDAYQIPGEFLLFVEGRHVTRAPLNLFGAFGGEQMNRYNYYTSPRYLPLIDLVGSEVSDSCENDS